MAASLLLAIAILAGKTVAYVLTGSAALWADAAESVVHIVATAFAAFSLWYASRPPDVSHPYGHGRIAYFSVGFEGLLVLSASLAVIVSGVVGLVNGVALNRLGTGLVVACSVAAANLALGLMLLHVGRRERVLILIANGRHVLADVLTTGAALVGLGAVMLTGWNWLDPLAAVLIGFWILASGAALLRESVAGLMDEVDPHLVKPVAECLTAAVEQKLIAGFHKLRCRVLQQDLWVDVHLQLPSRLTIVEAHDRATRLEGRLRACLPQHVVHTTTHLEPEDHASTHPAGHEERDDPLRHVPSGGPV